MQSLLTWSWHLGCTTSVNRGETRARAQLESRGALVLAQLLFAEVRTCVVGKRPCKWAAGE